MNEKLFQLNFLKQQLSAEQKLSICVIFRKLNLVSLSRGVVTRHANCERLDTRV